MSHSIENKNSTSIGFELYTTYFLGTSYEFRPMCQTFILIYDPSLLRTCSGPEAAPEVRFYTPCPLRVTPCAPCCATSRPGDGRHLFRPTIYARFWVESQDNRNMADDGGLSNGVVACYWDMISSIAATVLHRTPLNTPIHLASNELPS